MLALFQQFVGEIQSGEFSWHTIAIAERVQTLQNAREHSVCGLLKTVMVYRAFVVLNSYGVERRCAENT